MSFAQPIPSQIVIAHLEEVDIVPHDQWGMMLLMMILMHLLMQGG